MTINRRLILQLFRAESLSQYLLHRSKEFALVDMPVQAKEAHRQHHDARNAIDWVLNKLNMDL